MGLGIGVSGIAPIPTRVSNCRAYHNGRVLFGTADLQLPDIEFMTDTISGSGIAGEVEVVIDGMVKAMSASIKFNVPSSQQYGMLSTIDQGITFRAALQQYDAGSGRTITVPYACEIKGRVKKLTGGTLNPGSATDGANEITVMYYKVTIDNVVRCEIDPFNCVAIIDGLDYLSEVRSAI